MRPAREIAKRQQRPAHRCRQKRGRGLVDLQLVLVDGRRGDFRAPALRPENQ